MKTKILFLMVAALAVVPLQAAFTSIKTGTMSVGYSVTGAPVYIEYDVQIEPGTLSNTCLIKVRYPLAWYNPARYDFRVGAWFRCQSLVAGVGLRNGGGYSSLESSLPSQSTPYTPLSVSAFWITLASFQYAGGEELNLGRWYGEQEFSGSSWVWVQYFKTTVTLTAALPFKITFAIPYNDSIYTRHYVAYQGEVAVGIFGQPAGAAATTIEVGPLQSNVAVQLFMIIGGSVGDDETDTPVIRPGETEMIGVNSGTPVVGGVTVNNTTTPTVDAPAITTDPTPTITPPGSGITNPTSPTPTGTATATKTDIMILGNQIAAAIQAADGRAAVGANLTVTAINGVITGENKIVAALDKLNAKDSGTDMTATNNLLGTGNANTTAIKTAVETLVTNDAAKKTWDDARKLEAANAAANGQGTASGYQAAAIGQMTGLLPAHSFQDASPAAPSFFSITIPGRGALSSVDIINLNPFDSPEVSPVITFIKAVAAVFVSGLFTWWAYNYLAQYVMFSSLLQPAKGNTVAGSGGQITSALVAAWMTLVLLTLPTAIAALWTAGPLLPGISAINPFAAASDSHSQGALYLLYGFLPMATITTALTSMFVVQRGGLIVYFGTSAAIRWCIA